MVAAYPRTESVTDRSYHVTSVLHQIQRKKSYMGVVLYEKSRDDFCQSYFQCLHKSMNKKKTNGANSLVHTVQVLTPF
jgi:hypothetical protein